MSKLVEEMDAVVERHSPFCCEVGWSVVGNGSAMGSSYRDGYRIRVQGKGRLSTWAEKTMGRRQSPDDVGGVDAVTGMAVLLTLMLFEDEG